MRRRAFAPLLLLLIPSAGLAQAIDAEYGRTCARKKVIYKGKCLNDRQLRRAFTCPKGTARKFQSNDTFKERWCETPTGKKLGNHVIWINTADASGHIMRWTKHADDGTATATHYHALTHQAHQEYALKSGIIHGTTRVFDQRGTLRETLIKANGKLHGIAREFDENGSLAVVRCTHRGHLLWKTKGSTPPSRACPPKGFDPAKLPNNKKQILLSLGKGYPNDLYSIALARSRLYASMNSDKFGSGIFRLSRKKREEVGVPANTKVEDLGYEAKLVVPVKGKAKHLLITGGRIFFVDDYAVRSASPGPRPGVKTLAKNFAITKMVTDGQHLYFTNNIGPTEDDPNGPAVGIYRISVKGGKVKMLAKATGEPRGMGLAVGRTHIYWTDELAGTVNRTAKGGGQTKVLHRGQEPLAIALDGNRVYWSESGHNSNYPYFPADSGGAIFSLAADGTGKPRKLVAVGEQALALRCDKTHFYWTTSYGVMRVARSGKDPQYITTKKNTSRSFTLTKKHLYWADTVLGEVARIDKRARERQFGAPL